MFGAEQLEHCLLAAVASTTLRQVLYGLQCKKGSTQGAHICPAGPVLCAYYNTSCTYYFDVFGAMRFSTLTGGPASTRLAAALNTVPNSVQSAGCLQPDLSGLVELELGLLRHGTDCRPVPVDTHT